MDKNNKNMNSTDLNKLVCYIPKSLLKEKLSSQAIAVYCYLQSHLFGNRVDMLVTAVQLVYEFTGELKIKRRCLDSVEYGINELVKMGIISIKEIVHKHYLLDCSKLKAESYNNTFIMIPMNEVKRVLSTNQNNRFSLFRYYITLISTLDGGTTVSLKNGKKKKGVISCYTIAQLSTLSGFSQTSVIEYNKELEELNMIYVYRQECIIVNKDGSLRQLSNVYGRYKDQEYVEAFATNQLQQNKSPILFTQSPEANNKRKYAQIYNQLLKGNTQYSKDEISDAYNYIIGENEKYKSLYNKTNKKDYLNKIRNVEIFNQFNFINRE